MRIRAKRGLLRIVLMWLAGAGLGFFIMRLLGLSSILSLVVAILIATVVVGVSVATTPRADADSDDAA